MNFKTEIKLSEFSFNISHKDKVLSIGSCFSENIGEKMKERKFDILINPYGILFNPISVATTLNECLVNKNYRESDLNKNGELYISFNHHGSFSGLNPIEVLEGINKKIQEGNSFIKNSSVLILTLGSAWVYKRNETDKVVANCHKVPSTDFTKELLSVSEVVETLVNSIKDIKEVNPGIKIITTVSPVRHWKDGVVENQQSKATLHLALKELNETIDNSHYFPAYEIMMDELRDYRFYAKDMLHPSDLAIDYIWERFENSFFSDETKELNMRIVQINNEKNHKPFNPKSIEYIKFSQKLIEKEDKLFAEFPFLRNK